MTKSNEPIQSKTSDQNELPVTRRDLLKTGSVVAGAAALAACQGGTGLEEPGMDEISTPGTLESTKTPTEEQPEPTPTAEAVQQYVIAEPGTLDPHAPSPIENMYYPQDKENLGVSIEKFNDVNGFNHDDNGNGLLSIDGITWWLSSQFLSEEKGFEGSGKQVDELIKYPQIGFKELPDEKEWLGTVSLDGQDIKVTKDTDFSLRTEDERVAVLMESGYLVVFLRDGELRQTRIHPEMNIIENGTEHPLFEKPDEAAQRLAIQNKAAEKLLGQKVIDCKLEINDQGIGKGDMSQPLTGDVFIETEESGISLGLLHEKAEYPQHPQHNSEADFVPEDLE